MDKAQKTIEEHREIADAMELLTKLLAALTQDTTEGHADSIHSFFEKNIRAHFRWEEKELFPFLLEQCDEEEQEIIRELQNEHSPIVARILAFEQRVRSFSITAGGGILELTQANSTLVDEIIAHAQREDSLLVPLLRKYQI